MNFRTVTYVDTVPPAGGTVVDGDYGDIVVSGTGAAISLDPAVATAAGRALLDDADAATQRGTLGLGTAATANSADFATAAHTHAQVDVTDLVADLAAKQAADATLTALAALNADAGLLYQSGADTFSKVTVGAAAGNIPTVDDADTLYAALAHTHAQADVTNLTTDLAAKAPLASPTFTGTPAAPTAAPGTSTTQLATTEFVAAALTGKLVGAPRVFTSGTAQTYTPTAGTERIYVEVVGGGGQGGGASRAASAPGFGGGGGGGGYAARWYTTAGKTFTYTVGAGGSASGAGANNGQDGGNTTFTDGTTQITGGGGGGGIAMATGSSLILVGGGTRGAGSNGEMNAAGSPGQAGIRTSTTAGNGGNGGASYFGGGGIVRPGQGTGEAGGAYGGGGAGSNALTTNVAGGAGNAGVIRVWEFS